MSKNYISAKELSELFDILNAIEDVMSRGELSLGTIEVIDASGNKIAEITFNDGDGSGQYVIESAYDKED